MPQILDEAFALACTACNKLTAKYEGTCWSKSFYPVWSEEGNNYIIKANVKKNTEGIRKLFADGYEGYKVELRVLEPVATFPVPSPNRNHYWYNWINTYSTPSLEITYLPTFLHTTT